MTAPQRRIRPFLASGRARPVPPEEPEPPAAPRPFVLTSGRVLGRRSDLGLETQVSARISGPDPALARLPREQRAIVAACARPVSIAEISARLHLHLDVTKILVTDLSAAGYLEVHHVDRFSPTDVPTITRVIDGLRSLS